MMNQLANHGSRIRRYMHRWGRERVTEFIDHCMKIDTLIDPLRARRSREFKVPIMRDHRDYQFPRRLESERNYMDPWLNPKGWIDKENKRIKEEEAAEDLGMFDEPQKDIMQYLLENAALKPWQQDILAMLHEEALYFAPQRATKVANEGWASKIDFEIMCKQGLIQLGQKGAGGGIVEYAAHKMGVLGTKYGMNPYRLGFTLLNDIKERWDKGRFGSEWDECKDMKRREEWDTKAMKGKEKIFEVRKYYDDVMLINEFFTQEFCEKHEFFDWKKNAQGEYKIESRDWKKIKQKLVRRHLNGGLPDIRLVDPNHRGKGWMLLEHVWDGRILDEPYLRDTLTSVQYLWQKEVLLVTRNHDNKELVFLCVGSDPQKDIVLLKRDEYEKKW
jgi:stage V sporulation protein R